MKKFTLKSGNSTTFKNMGSSPLHKHDGTTSSTTHYKDGSAKSKKEVDFSKQHEQEIAKEASKKKSKSASNYEKRMEELLNQGFSQVEADQMIKEGGVTGDVEVKPKRDKKVEEEVKKTKSPAKDAGHKTKLPAGHGHETEEDIRKYGYDTVYAKRIAEKRAEKRKKHHAKYK